MVASIFFSTPHLLPPTHFCLFGAFYSPCMPPPSFGLDLLFRTKFDALTRHGAGLTTIPMASCCFLQKISSLGIINPTFWRVHATCVLTKFPCYLGQGLELYQLHICRLIVTQVQTYQRFPADLLGSGTCTFTGGQVMGWMPCTQRHGTVYKTAFTILVTGEFQQ